MASILNANVFPVKLWRLVNDCENDAIVWNEQGDGIVINKGLMEKEFFSVNGFKASSSSSFVRQLNFYGFKKSRPFNRDQPNTHHYFHPYFQWSQPELLPLLRRSAQQRRVRVQEYIQTDLTERWREHRNLHDDDGYADLHNEKDLDEDQKEPSHLVTQPSEPTVPPEFPDSINGAGSSLEPHLPQSPLPQSDLKMQQLQLSVKENIFPMKLWRLVNDCNIDAIVWNDQGDGIIVHKNLIKKDFLSLSGFKASSSSSFVRQLNSYGFKKSTPFTRDQPNAHMTGPALYFHPYFQRSQPELLPLLKRCASKCRVRVKEDIQTDLTERWREHPDLYDTDFGQHQGSSLVPCHYSNQMGPPMEMDQGQNSTEVAELPLPSARQVEEHLPSDPSKPLHGLKPGNWIMIKNPGSRRRKHCLWVGPHQVLQTSDTHVMIAEGATWLDSSQFEKLS